MESRGEHGGFWTRRRQMAGGVMASAAIVVGGCDALEDAGLLPKELDCSGNGASSSVHKDRLPEKFDLLDGSPYDDEPDDSYGILNVNLDGSGIKTELSPDALKKSDKVVSYSLSHDVEATVQKTGDSHIDVYCGPKAKG